MRSGLAWFRWLPAWIGLALAGPALAAPSQPNDAQTVTPIKHVIVILGENRTFDHIFGTFDEGGGYWDSGYIQPLDFFGDGTRVPLIAVSRFSTGGRVSHVYADHVSLLKFIEKNWSVPPITTRSRDNLSNPVASAANPYVPTNAPAIGDLMDMFVFPAR